MRCSIFRFVKIPTRIFGFFIGICLVLQLPVCMRVDTIQTELKPIAVMPFLKGRKTEPVSAEENAYPLALLYYDQDSLKDGAEKTMTRLVHEVLYRKYGERMIPLGMAQETWERLKNNNAKEPPSVIAQETGAALQAQYVVLGNVWRFKERRGTALSSESPASVAFTIYLLNVGNGKIVQRATFEKTQQALLDNILSASDFFKQGARWLTAEELARFGIKHILKKFSIL
ncbi:MAG: hypothetical protein SV775_10435 [Thermodesulfobacteriota bacterium]|nr:hypothetical protein [Thermodesulfobacteriota bacterium]